MLGPGNEVRNAGTIMKRGGVLGTASLYFGMHEQVQLYHRYAEAFVRGRDLRKPADDPLQGSYAIYRDVPVEYQPGKVLLMVPPALFSPRYEVYLPLFVLWCGLIYLGAVLGAWRLAGDGSAGQAARVLGWSFLFLVLFGPYVAGHLDQAVALICVVGWALFRRGWRGGSPGWFAAFGALAAAGVLVKVAPGVLLPAAGIGLLLVAGRPRWRDAFLIGGGFAITLGGAHAASVAAWGDGYLASYAFHLDRGIQIESTWAGVLVAGRALFGPLTAEYSFGSYHLVTPYTPLVRTLFPVAWFGLVGVIGWRAWKARSAAAADPVPWLTLVLLLGLVLTSKVFCFNYLLWITPLVPVLAVRGRGLVPLGGLYAVALGLTQFYRVYDYAHAKIAMPWQPVLVLNLRNAALLLLLGWLVWRLPRLLADATRTPDQADASRAG